jgi:hypothetical protein
MDCQRAASMPGPVSVQRDAILVESELEILHCEL